MNIDYNHPQVNTLWYKQKPIEDRKFFRIQPDIIYYRVYFVAERFCQHNAFFNTMEDAIFWINNFYLMAIANSDGTVYEDDVHVADIEEGTLTWRKINEQL